VITEADMFRIVREALQERGAATTLQHDAGITHSAASHAKHGVRIHPKIAKHFGYRRVVLYEPIE